MSALQEGRSIRAFDLPAYMSDKVYVTIRNFSKTRVDHHVVDQASEITRGTATEPRVLLTSLFPGITRSVTAKVPRVLAFDDTAKDEANRGLSWIFSAAHPVWGYTLSRALYLISLAGRSSSRTATIVC